MPFLCRVEKASTQKEFYTRIHDIADSLEPRIRKQFVEAVERLRSQAKLGELAEALRTGNENEVMRVMGILAVTSVIQPIVTSLRRVYEDAAYATMDLLPDARARTTMRFDLTNPRAVDWMRTEGLALIKNVTETSKEGIREIVTTALDEGGHPYVQAKKIKDMIGLNKRQVIAVRNYEMMLLSEGKKPEVIDRMVKAYYQRQLKYRARMIARTETINAANAGQLELWQQAIEQGLINPIEKVKQWIVTPDDRLCELCREVPGMNPGGVNIDQPFQTPLGPRMAPTLHPHCRCSISLINRKPIL